MEDGVALARGAAVMPYYMGNAYKNRPWRAAARRLGTFYHLGYFDSFDEAKEAEDDFATYYPPTRRQPHLPKTYHVEKIEAEREAS